MTTQQIGISSDTGLVGFLCEKTDLPVSYQACLECSRTVSDCPMFPAAISRIIESQRPQDHAYRLAAAHGGADYAFSVTEIVYCPRKYRLSKEYPFYEKPTALWRMLRGSAIHRELAMSGEGIAEKTLVWRFRFMGKTVALTGTPDLLTQTEDGWKVTDFKFTDYVPRSKKVFVCNGCQAETDENLVCPNCGQMKRGHVSQVTLPPQPLGGHGKQVNLYGLLVERAMKERVAGGEVIYLSKKPYKVSIAYNATETMDFLKSKLSALLSPELPPVLQEEGEKWECDYCPVRSYCEEVSQ